MNQSKIVAAVAQIFLRKSLPTAQTLPPAAVAVYKPNTAVARRSLQSARYATD
jgi:hypothetical protein